MPHKNVDYHKSAPQPRAKSFFRRLAYKRYLAKKKGNLETLALIPYLPYARCTTRSGLHKAASDGGAEAHGVRFHLRLYRCEATKGRGAEASSGCSHHCLC